MQSKMAKIIQLTSADAQYINKQMTKINIMADGRPKDIEIAKVLDYIAAKNTTFNITTDIYFANYGTLA